MDDEQRQLRGWAAVYLASVLLTRGDVVAARGPYAFAEREGPELASMWAIRGLAQILALEGDVAASRARFEAFIPAYSASRGWDMSARQTITIARLMAVLLARPRIGADALAVARFRFRPNVRRLVSLRSRASA